MFNFKIKKQSKKTMLRTGVLETSHGKIETPTFMPCATVGAVKGVSSSELKDLGYKLILSNTYHLYLRPGDKNIKKMGQLQKYMKWGGAILTDSGGYQVFSLGKNYLDYQNKQQSNNLAIVSEKGVTFKSHLDGSKHLFTPEKVIDIQRNLGSDIMMVLDECTEYPATHERAEQSMQLTHKWAEKAVKYHQKNNKNGQALFGIIQGSTYKNLRIKSAQFINNLPFDGIAVGGVSVGEGKKHMYEVIKAVGPLLDPKRPHYLMGIGEPEDIMLAVKYGFDMFDCVLPTRLGRHGTVWTTKNWLKFSKIDLRKSKYSMDKKPIMTGCGCPACKEGYSRAYISHLIKEKEMLGMRLTSLHNLWILSNLMQKIRQEV